MGTFFSSPETLKLDRLFLALTTEGNPWSHTGRIVKVEMSAYTRLGGVVTVEVTPEQVPELVSYITHHQVFIVVEDERAMVWIRAKWGTSFHYRGCRRIALAMAHGTAMFDYPPMKQVHLAEEALDDQGQYGFYRDAVHSAAILAEQTATGYYMTPSLVPDTVRTKLTQDPYTGRVHPWWSVVSQTGAPIITASAPPLTSLSSAARPAFPAPSGMQWVRMAWDAPELHVWQRLSSDPVLWSVLQMIGDPYDAVKRTLGAPEPLEDVKAAMRYYLTGVGFLTPEQTRLVHQCQRTFYRLTEYQHGLLDAPVRSLFGRRVPLDETRAPSEYLLSRVTQYSLGTAVHGALATLRLYRDVRQVIPVWDTIAMCVPLDADLTHLTRMFNAYVDGRPLFPVRFEAGPTWGNTEVVDTRSLAA